MRSITLSRLCKYLNTPIGEEYKTLFLRRWTPEKPSNFSQNLKYINDCSWRFLWSIWAYNSHISLRIFCILREKIIFYLCSKKGIFGGINMFDPYFFSHFLGQSGDFKWGDLGKIIRNLSVKVLFRISENLVDLGNR